MSNVVPLIEAVTRRHLAAHRTLSLGVVTEVRTNDGGAGDHHLDLDVQLHGTEMVLQRIPVAVGRIGLSMVPRVGDLVVIGFLDGDVNGAVVLGTIHDADTPSPDAQPDQIIYEVPDGGGGEKRIEIVLPDGNSVTVSDSGVTIIMGGSSLSIENGGAVSIESAGDITLKAATAVTIEAGTTVSISGLEFSAEASASAKLKGAITTIAGQTSFSAG